MAAPLKDGLGPAALLRLALHFVKANGQQRPKVLELEPGETVAIAGRRSFRQISTRKYHPGRHAIEILVNGRASARCEFDLLR